MPTELVLELLDREGNVRFTLASYYTRWENPFKIRVSAFSGLLDRTVSRDVRLVASTPASPLLEGTYLISRRWAIGFWYNPIRGERIRGTVMVAENPVSLSYSRDTDLADLHLIYYAPRGLSAQIGYYRESGTIYDRSALPLPPRDYTLQSWNFWLTQRLDLLTRGRLVSDRLDAHLIPFISAGYHPAAGLDHAVSLLSGVGVTFAERIGLSGSVWLFDLSRPATRITGGLVILY